MNRSDQIEYYATADHHEDIEKHANNLGFYPEDFCYQAKRFNNTQYFKELFEILIKKEISIIDQVNSNNNYLLAAIYKIMEGKNLQGKRSRDCTKEDLTKLNKYQKEALDEIISMLACHPDFKKWSETSYDSGRGPISKHFKNKNVLAYAQEVGLSQQTIKLLT